VIIGSAASAAILVAVHLLAGRISFAGGTRSAWLSFAGGISVTYVFLQLLPELAEGQEIVRTQWPGLAFIEHHVFLLALAGLGVFYGLESFVRYHRKNEPETAGSESDFVFWIHVSSFAIYNALIAYLIVERRHPASDLVWYTIAMALHFVVSDFALRNHHDAIYERYGRWILTGAIAAGFLASLVTHVSEPAVAVITSFLAGGVILNVMKEELPEEKESRFGTFAAGSILAAALLLVSA
jgi:hypothetical protein